MEQNMSNALVDDHDDETADALAAQIANGLTVEQQNYNFSAAARDRTVLSLKRNNVSKRPIVEAKKIEPVVSIAAFPLFVGEASGKRGRGLYGRNARRNRAAE
jgi:hypothetical protein